MTTRSATTTDPRTVVETAWAAFSAKDLDTLLNSFADDATWEIMGGDDFMTDGGTFTSKHDIATRLFPLAGEIYDLPTFSLTTRNVIVDGSTVVLEFTVNSKTTSGREYYDVKYIAVFEVANGKIKAIREYAHTQKAANVLYG
jgi:ketosteroid isomerase-like protein